MWLQNVERWADRLPHPMALFIYLCAFVLGLSWIGQGLSWSVQHPSTGDVIAVKSLVSADGFNFVFSSLVKNFMTFAPVGPVLVIALAFSLAEKSGLLPALITKVSKGTPRGMLAVTIAFLGVMSSIAVDSGYVVLLPLCAALFYSSGRHPLAGLALGFACVSGGFSANLLVGPVDAMLAGISSEAVQLVADRDVSLLGNYYFMLVSVPLIIGVTVLVNRFWVEPFLASHPVNFEEKEPAAVHELGKAFWLTMTGLVFVWLILTLPDDAILRHPDSGSLVQGPFMKSLVAMIAISVGLLATVYGRINRTIIDWKSWVQAVEQGIKDLAPYLALMFVVAQFIAWFKWSELGPVLAVQLAALMDSWSLSAPIALLILMLFTSVLNLFIGSASAKWALLAPILVPAFYLLGMPPEAVQGAYRVADSSTNIITPLMPYFPLVLAYAQKYDNQVGVGRLLTLMLPYSLALLVAWGLLLVIWLLLGLPFGPA